MIEQYMKSVKLFRSSEDQTGDPQYSEVCHRPEFKMDIISLPEWVLSRHDGGEKSGHEWTPNVSRIQN